MDELERIIIFGKDGKIQVHYYKKITQNKPLIIIEDSLKEVLSENILNKIRGVEE